MPNGSGPHFLLGRKSCRFGIYNEMRPVAGAVSGKFKMSDHTYKDTFVLGGKEFGSRLIIGTGKYRSFDEMRAAHKASGAEMVTVAVNRVPLDGKTESFFGPP